MSDSQDVRSYWAIEYRNGNKFISRVYDHWGYGGIATALLFDREDEARAALGSLWEEGSERLDRSKDTAWVSNFWWDIMGGALSVVEVQRILQKREGV